ncbi:hypothetical protein [Elioraea sp.]|uniref:hypothetical protein n=1 Tax=Elioraea sp. TaxID=2185103 RepID=UPI0025B8151E|nr:hypothetical protein [Elioraea sp.]
MRLSINQIRALPLIALSAGAFILAATVDVPADRTGPAIIVEAPPPEAVAAVSHPEQPVRAITLAGQ